MTTASTLMTPKAGAIMVGLAIAMYAVGRFVLLRTILVFVGILAIGYSGWLVHLIANVIGLATGLLGAWAGSALGVAASTVVAVLFAVAVFKLLHDWHPKTGKPAKSAFWLAALLAVAIVAGATPFAALNDLPQTLQTGLTQATSQGG